MRDHPDAVMIFAAGFGTRMGALTATCPKPLIPVAGKPLLEHALEQACSIAPRRIVVNTHYLADQIHTYVANKEDPNLRISHESEHILDTGGGLKHARPLLDADTVFTLNSDAVWRGPLALGMLADHWNPDEMDALLLCVPLPNTRGYQGDGNFNIGSDGRLTRGSQTVYSGAQIIKMTCLQDRSDQVFSLRDIWFAMAETGRLHGLDYPGNWADVGHPDGILAAETMLSHSHV